MSGSTLQELRGWKAVLFDLDGTLVHLKTDWKEAHRRVDDILRPHIDDDLSKLSLWRKVEIAREFGLEDVGEAIAALEVEGALRAEAFPLVHLVRSVGLAPFGVCTMNCRRSVEVSLGRFGLAEVVAVVVAREDCPVLKPDPLPLLRCLEALGVKPSEAIYVGDMRRDEEAARAAGMAFVPAQRFNGGTFPFEPAS
jgi:phosphoglycolate phosphatase